VRLGLERIRTFLGVLDEPHLCAPVVHIAGTNGKGSTSTFITAALVHAGYRVGTTTSPHLESINERVAIDGIPVDDGTLTEAIEHIDRARWSWARTAGIEGTPLTYFEFMVAVAFQVFAWRQVDVMVVEVGLGGRLDATNVVNPVATAVTSIGLDHTEVLGEDLPTIAGEKAGILKRGVPVAIGPMTPEARAVIEARAKVLGCSCWSPGVSMRKEIRRDGRVNLATPGGSLEGVTLGLRGAHQASNAMVALAVLHQLRNQGFLIPDEAIRAGFAAARVPGRLEQLLPGLVADGAHNPAGTKALADWLAQRPCAGARILLFGMGDGRDPVDLVRPLLPHVDEVVTTACAHPKAMDPMALATTLAGAFGDDAVISAGGTIEETLPEVYEEAHETVVCGSLFLAGAARSMVSDGALEGLEPGHGPRPDGGDEQEAP
jgi:dihydrofolate synthase/folylpolyglutamate synthase